MNTPLLAFHDNPDTKTKYLARVTRHRIAGGMIKDYWWDEKTETGCAVGCTIHGSDPGAYENELGIPAALGWLESSLHIRMREDRAIVWAEEFLEAITPGDDLSLVNAHFMYWLLTAPEGPRGRCASGDHQVLDVVTTYYVRQINEGEASASAWYSETAEGQLLRFPAHPKRKKTRIGKFADAAWVARNNPVRIWETVQLASEMMGEEYGGAFWESMADRLIALLRTAERGLPEQILLPSVEAVAC